MLHDIEGIYIFVNLDKAMQGSHHDLNSLFSGGETFDNDSLSHGSEDGDKDDEDDSDNENYSPQSIFLWYIMYRNLKLLYHTTQINRYDKKKNPL